MDANATQTMSTNNTDDSRSLMMDGDMFCRVIKESYDKGRKFCFIIGAGASVESGIPLGTDLIKKWRAFLKDEEQKYPGAIRQRASLGGIDYDKDVVRARLFEEDYKIQSSHYFTFFDLRFPFDPVVAHSELQELMEGAKPSIGYYALAILLLYTENKLVITTNFDTLTEDSVFLYNGKHALVAGHESLAPFVGNIENKKRPIVLKVHGDLLLHPKNRKKELERLDNSWRGALSAAFAYYTPIVIGYAGGDSTLMGFLKETGINSIYWCTLSKTEEDEDQCIRDFLSKQEHGYLVTIKGFDEILYDLLGCFLPDIDFEPPYDKMKSNYNKLSDEYIEQLQKIISNIQGSTNVVIVECRSVSTRDMIAPPNKAA